jgi:hypothetical protein
MPAAYQQAAALENSLGLHYSRFGILGQTKSSTSAPKIPKAQGESAKLG